MTIRKARKDDLDGLALLSRRLFRYHEELDRRFKLDLVGLSGFRDVLRDMLKEGKLDIWLAEDEGQPLGFIAGDHSQGADGAPHGLVSVAFVEEADRRRGLGTALFQALRGQLASLGVRGIELVVAWANPLGRAFWESLGFQGYMGKLWLELSGVRREHPVPPEIRIRPAEGRDLAEAEALRKELVEYQVALDGRARLRMGAAGEALEEWLAGEDQHTLVAESEGALMGLARGLVGKNWPVFALSRYGQVSGLFVAPAWRGKGVGAALLGALEEWFRGQGFAVLQAEVLSRDGPAQRFFRGLGFRDYMLRLWLDLEPGG